MKQSEIDAFNAERRRFEEESRRVEALILKYEADFPIISGFWDTSEASIPFNDIDQKFVDKGLSIYTCDAAELWEGLYEPEIYDADTLWNGDLHDKRKIAKVIDAWNQRQALSPIFLVKHGGEHNLGLVADGKHRLTVSRAIESDVIPFMVQTENSDWVKLAFPNAIVVRQTDSRD